MKKPTMKKPTLHLLVRTYSSDENFDGDCSYAVITIDSDERKSLKARRKICKTAKKSDSHLFEMYFWNAPVYFYPSSAIDFLSSEDQDRLMDGNVIELTEEQANSMQDKMERVECDQTIILTDEFRFTAIPKHTSLYVTTESLGYDRL